MEQTREIKTLTALVRSRSGDKSLTVVIDYKVKHPRYGKYVRRRTKFGVHDQDNKADVGDVIEIAHSRPYSKTKRWRLVRVIKKGQSE